MKKNRRKYTNEKIDYTCIEILDEDEIEQFFKIDESYLNNINILKDKEIFVLQYPNGGELKHSSGRILDIVNNEIHHSSATYYASSGSPLIKRYNNKLILGIHRGDVTNINKKVLFNLAIPFNIIIEDINSKINNNIINNNTIINLIYNKKDYEDYFHRDNNIFGNKFVENNKDNITLIINGKESKLISKYNLNEGRNIIQMKI